MFGIMGCDAAFAKAGSAHKQEEIGNKIILQNSIADPSLAKISCTGEIVVKSIKDGSVLKERYNDLSNTQLSIQSDANTDIEIIGDVTAVTMRTSGPPAGNINWTKINITNHTALINFDANGLITENIVISECENLFELRTVSMLYLKQADFSNNQSLYRLEFNGCPALENINISGCGGLGSIDGRSCTLIEHLNTDIANAHMGSIDLSGCTALKTLNVSKYNLLNTLDLTNCAAITQISYPATNSNVSTVVAGAIANATAADGTVYTDSAGAYYSTIADAATAKGWTIEQLS